MDKSKLAGIISVCLVKRPCLALLKDSYIIKIKLILMIFKGETKSKGMGQLEGYVRIETMVTYTAKYVIL